MFTKWYDKKVEVFKKETDDDYYKGIISYHKVNFLGKNIRFFGCAHFFNIVLPENISSLSPISFFQKFNDCPFKTQGYLDNYVKKKLEENTETKDKLDIYLEIDFNTTDAAGIKNINKRNMGKNIRPGDPIKSVLKTYYECFYQNKKADNYSQFCPESVASNARFHFTDIRQTETKSTFYGTELIFDIGNYINCQYNKIEINEEIFKEFRMADTDLNAFVRNRIEAVNFFKQYLISLMTGENLTYNGSNPFIRLVAMPKILKLMQSNLYKDSKHRNYWSWLKLSNLNNEMKLSTKIKTYILMRMDEYFYKLTKELENFKYYYENDKTKEEPESLKNYKLMKKYLLNKKNKTYYKNITYISLLNEYAHLFIIIDTFNMDFYLLNRMFYNLIRPEEDSKSVIVITGGFHTETYIRFIKSLIREFGKKISIEYDTESDFNCTKVED